MLGTETETLSPAWGDGFLIFLFRFSLAGPVSFGFPLNRLVEAN